MSCAFSNFVTQSDTRSSSKCIAVAPESVKLADNTLLIVTSDNGGVLDHGETIERHGDVNTNNGHAQNGPLRGNKGMPYEGGTRVPFVARWPGKIAPGTSDELFCFIDALATCATLVGRELPDDAAPDSFNFLPVFLGEKREKPVRESLIEQGNRLALRQGYWKFISANPNAKATYKAAPSELYNLADDLGETKDLADSNPKKVKELSALLQQLRTSARTRQ